MILGITTFPKSSKIPKEVLSGRVLFWIGKGGDWKDMWRLKETQVYRPYDSRKLCLSWSLRAVHYQPLVNCRNQARTCRPYLNVNKGRGSRVQDVSENLHKLPLNMRNASSIMKESSTTSPGRGFQHIVSVKCKQLYAQEQELNQLFSRQHEVTSPAMLGSSISSEQCDTQLSG